MHLPLLYFRVLFHGNRSCTHEILKPLQYLYFIMIFTIQQRSKVINSLWIPNHWSKPKGNIAITHFGVQEAPCLRAIKKIVQKFEVHSTCNNRNKGNSRKKIVCLHQNAFQPSFGCAPAVYWSIVRLPVVGGAYYFISYFPVPYQTISLVRRYEIIFGQIFFCDFFQIFFTFYFHFICEKVINFFQFFFAYFWQSF